ncbi:MAG: hypothetical protein IT458_05435 [Planctomycetes bacterium]|nr:hypothetical protein [Planctomycetota bacterium]
MWAALFGFALAGCSSGGEATGSGGTGGGGRGGGPGSPLEITPVFQVVNDHDAERLETVRASIPFPRGMLRTLDRIGVSGEGTAWLPMQTWPDGSVRIAQAQFTTRLAGREKRVFRVVRDVTPLTGTFERNPWVANAWAGFRLKSRVRDVFDVPYEAEVSGEGEVVQSTYLARVSRHRVYHRAVGATGIGRDFLSANFYVTEFRDQPYVLVDWVLGNDYLGADDARGSTDPNLYPLGDVDVNSAEFLVRGATETRPYLGAEHAVGAARDGGNGFTGFEVMNATYLGDCQMRRYRFVLRFEHPNGEAGAKAEWRARFAPLVEAPLFPLCDLDTWQKSAGLGLHGGPIRGSSDAEARAQGAFQGWKGAGHFGTWGSFGETLSPGQTGTPRNGPVSEEAAWAIQGATPRLLQVLEQKAWVQAVRPIHMHGLSITADQDVCLFEMPTFVPGGRKVSNETYGRYRLWNADPWPAYRTRVPSMWNGRYHGFGSYSTEHWTTDLLFDYWTLSGDAWARDEMRHMGELLKGVLRFRTYATQWIQAARAEGWCLTGFVQVYQATGEAHFKEYAVRRMREVIDAQRMKSHPSRTLIDQGPYGGTGFPANTRFYMPWQHGAVLLGCLGAHRFFDEPLALQIAEDVTTAVEYAWVTNYQDPRFGWVANGLRYYVPLSRDGVPIPANAFDADPAIGAKWGDSPLGGAHSFLVPGLYLLSARSANQQVKAKAKTFAALLLGSIDSGPAQRANKWFAVIPEELLR